MTPPAKGERELIRRIAAELGQAGRPSPMGVPFGDDMAWLPVCPDALWTVDMLMDGVDFDSRVCRWYDVGRKALAVNLSDCAAMGVQPLAALCAVALADTLSLDDALEITRGMRDLATQFDCAIVGGDTNSWPQPTVISVTIAARVPAGQRPIRRDGAEAGDLLFVTGAVGGSILGRHLTFTPRVECGMKIAATLAPTAMIDISDGLGLDLARIASASGCGALLDEALLQAAIHADARRLAAQTGRDPLAHALEDGEDFELLVALRPPIDDAALRGLQLIRIGEMTGEHGLRLRRANSVSVPIEPRGWEHFQ